MRGYTVYKPDSVLIMHFPDKKTTLVIGTMPLDRKDTIWIQERCDLPIFNSATYIVQLDDSISKILMSGLEPDSIFISSSDNLVFKVQRFDPCRLENRLKTSPYSCGGCNYEISHSIWNKISYHIWPIKYVDFYILNDKIVKIKFLYQTH